MKHQSKNRRRRQGLAPRAICGAVAFALLAAQAAPPAHAGAAEQAKRIYGRIAGVPPKQTDIANMVSLIGSPATPSSLQAAAAYATTAPSFYNVTLKEFINP